MLAVLRTDRKMAKIFNPNMQSASYSRNADVWAPGGGGGGLEYTAQTFCISKILSFIARLYLPLPLSISLKGFSFSKDQRFFASQREDKQNPLFKEQPQ